MDHKLRTDRSRRAQGGSGTETNRATLDRRSLIKTVGMGVAGAALGQGLTGSALGAHTGDDRYVHVNQVGYSTDDQKIAVVTEDSGDASVDGISEFDVVDVNSGNTVFTGTATDGGGQVHANRVSAPFEDVPVIDESVTSTYGNHEVPVSLHRVRHLDFTDLTTPGEYRIEAGEYQSAPFRIGAPVDVYGDLMIDVGRLYTLHRANTEVTDEHTALDIGPGHLGPNQDQEALVKALSGSETLADYGITSVAAGDRIDVTGGWYDAGDYGKYTVNLAVTAAQLMLAYERNPGIFTEGQFGIPDSVAQGDSNVGAMPDLLAEVKYGLQFLQNMQVEEANGEWPLFFKVAGDQTFPPDDVGPSEDNQERYVFGISSAATAMGAAVFAQAARVFDGVDAPFAQEMQTRAENAFAWLETHRPQGGDTVWAQSTDQDAGSGAYERSPSNFPDDPDRYWAAAELLRLTGDQQYEDYITGTGGLNDHYSSEHGHTITAADAEPIDWNNPIALGHYAYYQAGGVNAGEAAGAGPRGPWGMAAVAWTVNDRVYGSVTSDDRQEAYPTLQWDYYWGCLKSGVSRGVQALLADDMGNGYTNIPDTWTSFDHATETTNWATAPLHHVLGRSATGYSYVTEYGETSTDDPHSRITNTDTLLPGMLVGGPHNTAEMRNAEADSTSEHLQADATQGPEGGGCPHALAYYDDLDSFATNEWAINYTAPLLWLLAELIDTPPQPQLQSPYNGPHQVPGRVEAEDFDQGGEGVSYHDTTSVGVGSYRDTSVDIGTHGNGDHHTGLNAEGEWLEYTVEVQQAGTYAINAQVGAQFNSELAVSVDGESVGSVSFQSTGDYRNWRLVSPGTVHLTEGLHTIRFDLYDGFDFDWFEVTDQGPFGKEHDVPGRVNAEEFDYGGQDVAYHDTRSYAVRDYREDNEHVTIDYGSEEGPNEDWHIGWIGSGEWWEYTVYAPSGGSYVFNAMVASDGASEITVSVDGVEETSVSFGATGGYDTYRLVSAGSIDLNPGRHVIRLTAGDANFDIDWWELTDQGPYGLERSVPGRIQAEDFDYGANGVAYNDTTGVGVGSYRGGSVDIGTHFDDGNRDHHTGLNTTAEWLEYTVYVEETAQYNATVNVGTTAPGLSCTVSVDGEEIEEIPLPNTDGYRNWQLAGSSYFELEEGRHVIRIGVDDDMDFDWFAVTRDTEPPTRPRRLNSSYVWINTHVLSWEESTDEVTGVDHYNVYVDGTKKKEANGSPTVINAARGSEVAVTAVDGRGNESDPATRRV